MNLLTHEKNLFEKGINLIAGIDEVGRGCLAGPMVVGAVILDMDLVFQEYVNPNSLYNKIKDSKLLTKKSRDELSAFIKQNCLSYSVFSIDAENIDKEGISICTQKAFLGAIKGLNIKPSHILTDAFAIKSYPDQIQTNLIHGDNLSISIAAASIVAKVFRDSLMTQLSENPKYSMYGFEKHKGYGTKYHLDAIKQNGISDIHRKTFIH